MTNDNAAAWDYEQRNKKQFNIIGFSNQELADSPERFHCVIHKYAILVKVKNQMQVLVCPECGIKYTKKDLMMNTALRSKKSKNRKSIITSKKRVKKLLDQNGNEINQKDKGIMLDVARGNTVRSYHEYIQ